MDFSFFVKLFIYLFFSKPMFPLLLPLPERKSQTPPNRPYISKSNTKIGNSDGNFGIMSVVCCWLFVCNALPAYTNLFGTKNIERNFDFQYCLFLAVGKHCTMKKVSVRFERLHFKRIKTEFLLDLREFSIIFP